MKCINLYGCSKADIFAKIPNKALGTDKSRMIIGQPKDHMIAAKIQHKDNANATVLTDNTKPDLQQPIKDDETGHKNDEMKHEHLPETNSKVV